MLNDWFASTEEIILRADKVDNDDEDEVDDDLDNEDGEEEDAVDGEENEEEVSTW